MSTRSTAGATRGVLWLSGAKLYFMMAGAVLQILLPSVVSRVTFGALAVVSSLVSPLNNVVVTGTIQTVARGLAQAPQQPQTVGAAGLRMQLYVGLPLAVLFALCAPLWGFWLGDRSKDGPLAFSALIVAAYAIYAVLVGLANGQKQFHRQAGLDVTFATLRVTLMLGAGALGLGLWGVLGGWVLAGGLIIVVAAAWVGWPKAAGVAAAPASTAPAISPRVMAKTFVGLAVYLALSNALLFVDTWMLKRAAGAWYEANLGSVAQGLAEAAPWLTDISGYVPTAHTLADVQVAYYGAAQNVARLTYQAMVAVAFVVFPLISQATFSGDREAAGRYVQATLRYSLIAVCAMAVGMAAVPQGLLDIPYATDYAAAGATSLRFLAFSNAALALLSIAATIANAAGLERVTWRIAAGTVLAIVVASGLAMQEVRPGTPLLERGALVVLVGIAGGLVAMLWYLRRTWRHLLAAKTVARVGLAVVVALAAARGLAQLTEPRGVVALAIAACAVAIYAGILLASGELRWRHWATRR